MPLEPLSHFDEKSGCVRSKTPWGCWWQTVEEVHIEVNLPKNTKSRDVSVVVKPKYIEVSVNQTTLFKGPLFSTVHPDDLVWTIEDGCLLDIILSKTSSVKKDEIWGALLEGGGYQPDPLTLHEMRKKVDLEHFQLENPGFDFSNAQLQKCYDDLPGMSSTQHTEVEGEPESPLQE